MTVASLSEEDRLDMPWVMKGQSLPMHRLPSYRGRDSRRPIYRGTHRRGGIWK